MDYSPNESKNSRKTIFLILLFLIFFVGLYFLYYNPFSPKNINDVNLSGSFSPIFKGAWIRDVNDLPVYIGETNFYINNLGNLKTNNVKYTIYNNEYQILDGYIDIINNDKYIGTINHIKINYDSNVTLKLVINYEGYLSTFDKTYSIKFPRHSYNSTCRFFITPNETNLKRLNTEITNNQLIHWTAIRDWVGTNIKYEYDQTQFNTIDYWQFPLETIKSRKGDCEDSAILLCSLLRSEGWKPEDVFVVVGEVEGVGHAWVTAKINDNPIYPIWINMEPTSGGLIISQLLDFTSGFNELIGKTTRAYYFNDVYFTFIVP